MDRASKLCQLAPRLVQVRGGPTPLLDAVDIEYGPRALLSEVFLAAEAQALSNGIDISVHEDLQSLAEANALLRDSWGPLVPILNPAHSDLGRGKAFWLSAVDRASATLVSTCAVRLFDVRCGDLVEDFESLRIFYRDPAPYHREGMTCAVLGQSRDELKNLSGRVGFIGALWTNPEFRGRNIIYMLGKLARALAVSRWDVDYVFGGFRVNLEAKGVLPNYGYSYLSRHIAIRNSYRGDWDLHVGWMGREQVASVLQAYVEASPRKADRVRDDDETTSPLGVTQGSSNRL